MTPANPSLSARIPRLGPAATLIGGLGIALAVALVAVGPTRLIAQIEGDRGIQPLATTSDISVNGIEVNVTGSSGEDARYKGWLQAAKLAWAKAGGPSMPENQIQSMVSAVVIEREQIGPHRYIATLGVVFDRQKAGQYIGGGSGAKAHSAPLLLIPVLFSGGTAQVYEARTPWQQAWAMFRSGTSPIDYVRPVGAGGDSLLVTAGQPSRRSRAWWRGVLDQFGAADVLIAEARLERQWPGGPVRGTFTARYGPDNTFLETFTLTANDEKGVPAMLEQAVVHFDQIFAKALEGGLLKPDSSLTMRQQIDPALAALIAAGRAGDQPTDTASQAAPNAAPTAAPAAPVVVNTFTIQFASPDAGAVDAALGAVRGSPGVQSAATTSLAMGGTSVMRVTFAGDLGTLAESLRARGWKVTVGNNALSIRR